jgi:WD40 repeat protein
MKKSILMGLLVAAAAGAQAQTVIYDSLFTDATQATLKTVTDTGASPRFSKADAVSFANYGPGQNAWAIREIGFTMINWATTTFTGNAKAQIRVWNLASDANSGTTDTMSGLVFDQTVDFGSVTMNPSTFLIATLSFAPDSFILNQPNGNLYGFGIRLLADDVENNNFSAGLTTGPAPYVGGSTDGWYRDVANDGIFQGTDKRIFTGNPSQLALSIKANPVPEPASMAVLGIGAAALLRRRKKA